MQVTVGIVGIEGKYGQWLKQWFERLDNVVIGSDLNTKMTNKDVVETAEVVIFSVPIDVSVQVILEASEWSRSEQLFLDITGLKQEQVEAMLQSQAEVVGLHPMCAPTVESWKGQTVIVCPERLIFWKDWLDNFLKQTQACVKELSPSDHDRLMSVVQCMVHAVSLNMAGTLRAQGVDVRDTLEVASPFYRIALSLMGRILGQGSKNYANMQMFNPHTLSVLCEIERQILHFKEIVETGNVALFQSEFFANAQYLGQDNVSAGFDLFQQLIRLMADLSEENSLTLVSNQDSPGVLAQITAILADERVNLTSLHSFKLDGEYRFVIGFDRAKDSPEVTLAIQTISASVEGVRLI